MSDVSRLPSFPRGALVGAGGLVALALAMAISGRLNGPEKSVEPTPAVMQRDLSFDDRADGTLAVTDTDSHALVSVIGHGQDNFVRATMRGLAQQRIRDGLGPQMPFRLTRWADGRLTLLDPDTRRSVELEAFGETNETAFARLLLATETPLSGSTQ